MGRQRRLGRLTGSTAMAAIVIGIASAPAMAGPTCEVTGGGNGNASSVGAFDFACGANSVANSPNSSSYPASAFGDTAIAVGIGATSIGSGAYSGGGVYATALGIYSQAQAATSVALGHRPTATMYAPTSADLQTWRSPGGVYVLRSAAVDEPMAWRTALADAFDAVSGSGRVVVVLSEAAHEMSEETLTTLAAVTTDRPWSVLVTAGRAADVLVGRAEIPLQVHPTPSALSAALTREAVAGDVVSVITARGELIEGISRDLFEAMAPIKLRIDVGAMALNVAAIRRQCPGAMVMAVPSLTEAERQAVRAAIAEAETRTAGEIFAVAPRTTSSM